MAADAMVMIGRKKDGEWPGWSIGDASFAFANGGLARVVSGGHGEDRIRVTWAPRRIAGHEERRQPNGAAAIATPTRTSQSGEVMKKL
jgi:hypothetical protein